MAHSFTKKEREARLLKRVAKERAKQDKARGDITRILKPVEGYDPLKPSVSLLAKLGSIAVHVDEGGAADGSEGGHPFDWITIRSLLADPEVREWIAAMNAMAFIPKQRSGKV